MESKHINALMFWLFFLFLAGSLSVIFIGKVGLEWYSHKKYDKKTPGKIVECQIDKNKKKYKINVLYEYFVEGQKKKGAASLKKTYINYYSALESLRSFSKKDCYIWYCSSNTKKSKLEKNISIKNLIYGFIALIVFFYFVFLRKKTEKF